jgi:hypothetical protein
MAIDWWLLFVVVTAAAAAAIERNTLHNVIEINVRCLIVKVIYFLRKGKRDAAIPFSFLYRIEEDQTSNLMLHVYYKSDPKPYEQLATRTAIHTPWC